MTFDERPETIAAANAMATDAAFGAVVAAEAEAAATLAYRANVTGVVGAPFDSYQTLRGPRALFVRAERQQRTAMGLAEFLAAHKRFSAVHYPGLSTHPGHALAAAGVNDGLLRLSVGLEAESDLLLDLVQALGRCDEGVRDVR